MKKYQLIPIGLKRFKTVEPDRVLIGVRIRSIKNIEEKMAEKSITEQVIDKFIGKITKQEILKEEKLFVLKAVLDSDKPKKADILKAIREEK